MGPILYIGTDNPDNDDKCAQYGTRARDPLGNDLQPASLGVVRQ